MELPREARRSCRCGAIRQTIVEIMEWRWERVARAAETTACRAAATVIVRLAPALPFKLGPDALRIHFHSATGSRGPTPTAIISIVVTTVPDWGTARLTLTHAIPTPA